VETSWTIGRLLDRSIDMPIVRKLASTARAYCARVEQWLVETETLVRSGRANEQILGAPEFPRTRDDLTATH